MKYRILALENIESESESVVATPITGVALYDAPNKAVFGELNNEAGGWVKDIGEKTDAIISLEAISHQLAKSTATTLGTLGAKYANLAIEQICNKANITFEELPLDTKKYETNPSEEISSGVAGLNTAIVAMQDVEKKDLVSLLGVLTSKRDYVNKVIRSIYARLGEIDENLERIKELGGDVGPTEQEIDNPAWLQLACVRYDISTSSLTCSTLKHLLANHSHVYKRLVKKQLDWISDHKENLLTSVNGFKQYSFDPKEYLLSGANVADSGNSNDKSFYYSDPLPGDATYTVELPSTITYGYDACDAIKQTNWKLVPTAYGMRPKMRLVAPVLSLEDIRARSAEIKSLLEDIRHWSDIVYMKLWKDAIYDCDVIGHLLTEQAQNLNQRGLTALASVVIDLLHKADGGIGNYALNTVDVLLKYVEESMSKYITHQEVYSK